MRALWPYPLNVPTASTHIPRSSVTALAAAAAAASTTIHSRRSIVAAAPFCRSFRRSTFLYAAAPVDTAGSTRLHEFSSIAGSSGKNAGQNGMVTARLQHTATAAAVRETLEDNLTLDLGAATQAISIPMSLVATADAPEAATVPPTIPPLQPALSVPTLPSSTPAVVSSPLHRPLVIHNLSSDGCVPYMAAWSMQRDIVRAKVAFEKRVKQLSLNATWEQTQAGLGVTNEDEQFNRWKEWSLLSACRSDAGYADRLLLLEHQPVYTLGRNASLEHLRFPSHVRIDVSKIRKGGVSLSNGTVPAVNNGKLAVASTIPFDIAPSADFELLRVERGGEVTYHGPGQIVLYPLLALKPSPLPLTSTPSPSSLPNATAPSPYRADLHWFLRSLESVVIRLLKLYDIEGVRMKGASGVWVRSGGGIINTMNGDQTTLPSAFAPSSSPSTGLRKIASIGLACSSWVTSHGLSINVDMDMSAFDYIVPCGLTINEQHTGVTSMRQVLEKRRMMEQLRTMNGDALSLTTPIHLDRALIRRQLVECFCQEFGIESKQAQMLQAPPSIPM